MTTQRLTYLVTVKVENTKGIAFNADQIASAIIGWGCGVECEGPYDVESATVSAHGVTAEWRRTGGKVSP